MIIMKGLAMTMLKRRILKLAVVAITIASASGLVGLSAAPAPAATAYHVGIQGTNPCLCLDAGVHNQVAQISTDHTRAAVEFLGPYHLSGDSTNWWELEVGDNLCLDADPANGWLVYAESCQPGDEEEWWDNHSGLQFENAAGNLAAGEDTWLWWFNTDCDAAGDTCNLRVIAAPTQPLSWWEGAL
jgi:hypothetical protein